MSAELVGVDDCDFGAVVLGVLLVLVGAELWVAAIAAPLPAVRARTADANRTVRLGLLIAPPFLGESTPAGKRPAMSPR